MLAAEDVMRTILVETVEDSRESGRTMCGRSGTIKGPLSRFPAAVELDTVCPLRLSGAWHSHTHRINEPVHSLPDVANVVFGNIDASVVVGAESSEALVRAEHRDVMAEAFQDALGLEIESPEGVVDALRSGRIPDPAGARRRVRGRLAPLFIRSSTNFPDISAQVPARFREPASGCPDLQFHATFYDHEASRLASHCQAEFRELPRERSRIVKALARTETARQVRQIIVATMTRRILFQR